MSLQLCPAPLFLESNPFCSPSTRGHLQHNPSVAQLDASLAATEPPMDISGVLPPSVLLDGAVFGAPDGKHSISPSPGALSSSIATTTSPYPPTSSSSSSTQVRHSDTPLARESKRRRFIGRQPDADSGRLTELGDAQRDQRIEDANGQLAMNYSQTPGVGSQASSAAGILASAAIPNGTYPAVADTYWNNNFLTGGALDKPATDGTVNDALGGEGPMYGKNLGWDRQDITMPINSMHQSYVPRRTANDGWAPNVQHRQHPQPSQQQMHGTALTSPYHSPLTVGGAQQVMGDYTMVDGQAHHIVPSNAYGPPGSRSGTSTPHQNPGPPAAPWQPSALGGGSGNSSSGGHGAAAGSVASMNGSNARVQASMRSSSGGTGMVGSSKDVKSKVLASPAASLPRKSPIIQQSAATKSERARSGDRTTHNDVERKYRTNLKDRIAELRAAIPALQAQQEGDSDGTTSNHSAPKVSKGTVLSKATEYIHQLEQANRGMMNERQQLLERLQTLEAMLQTSGQRPPQFVPSHGLTLFDPRGFS